MLCAAARHLLEQMSQRPRAASAAMVMPSVPDFDIAPSQPEPQSGGGTPWPAARLALVDQLWGRGFIFPGGEAETLRLTRPLGTSAATSLLLVGVGSGGPASAVTRNLGAWVTGMDNDPSLLAAARGLISRSQLSRKVSIKAWDPAGPDFGIKSHHHCLALEPLHGERPEPILAALTQGLKPGGHLVMTELTAETPLSMADPTVRRWASLERRDPASMMSGVAITRMLGRVGLDIRIAEDISDRHVGDAILGWRVMLRELQDQKPGRQQAALLIAEAELWLLRRRLIKEGRLKMMRWHAISRVPIV